MLGPPMMMKGNSSAISHAGGVSVGQKIVYVVSLAVAFCHPQQCQLSHFWYTQGEGGRTDEMMLPLRASQSS